MIHLAHLRYLLGDYRQAKEQIEHVIGVQQRMLPEGHIDIARSWIVLGRILTRTGEAVLGETYLRQAMEVRSRALAPGHRSIAEAQSVLGDCLIEQGRHAEAETLLLASHAVFEKKFGGRDPRTQEIGALLVRLYETWRKPELAAPCEQN